MVVRAIETAYDDVNLSDVCSLLQVTHKAKGRETFWNKWTGLTMSTICMSLLT